MRGKTWVLGYSLTVMATFAKGSAAQTPLSWQQIEDKFRSANPTLSADQIGVEEARASEITAFLRPNPTLNVLGDQINPFPGGPAHGPLAYLLSSAGLSYLYERDHKRNLRLESAKDATRIAVSNHDDLYRNLVFNLRMAFVQTLQGKAVFDLAKENLAYYDHLLDLSRERYKAGGIAQVDLDRLELQRVQYEADLQAADVSLRTAKIQLLALLNDGTPVDQFDVVGTFDFSPQMPSMAEVR